MFHFICLITFCRTSFVYFWLELASLSLGPPMVRACHVQSNNQPPRKASFVRTFSFSFFLIPVPGDISTLQVLINDVMYHSESLEETTTRMCAGQTYKFFRTVYISAFFPTNTHTTQSEQSHPLSSPQTSLIIPPHPHSNTFVTLSTSLDKGLFFQEIGKKFEKRFVSYRYNISGTE